MDEEAKRKARELIKWTHQNNTIPFKDVFKGQEKSSLQLMSLDGGWVNGLKLQRKIEELFEL